MVDIGNGIGNHGNVVERQLVTFHLGDGEFGTDIGNVKEIVRVPPITKLPDAPESIEGVCNLRGRVLPVIDGRTKLGMDRKETDRKSRLIVIDADGVGVGVLVDRVSRVLRVNAADIEKPSHVLNGMNGEVLQGIVKLDGGQRLVMLIDIIKLAEFDGRTLNQLAEHNGTLAGDGPRRDAETVQVVSFLLGEEEYAIGIRQAREILRVPKLTKVPGGEEDMEGVVLFRGELIPVINLRTRFGLESREITKQTKIIIVHAGGVTAGFMVDRVMEVLRIRTDAIEPPPDFTGQMADKLTGVARLDGGKRLILLLEPENMFRRPPGEEACAGEKGV